MKQEMGSVTFLIATPVSGAGGEAGRRGLDFTAKLVMRSAVLDSGGPRGRLPQLSAGSEAKGLGKKP